MESGSQAFQRGVFRTEISRIYPGIYDYEAMNPEELLKCPVLFIVSDECMEPKVQENLAEYVRLGRGGSIISGIFPVSGMQWQVPVRCLAMRLGLRQGKGDPGRSAG